MPAPATPIIRIAGFRMAGIRIAAILLLMAVGAAPIHAQDGTDPFQVEDAGPGNLATIEAVSYGPIPPGARLVTQPETQGEMDDAAWRLADDDLAARGYEIATDGTLVFTVATQLVDRLSTDRSPGSQGANSAVADGMQFSTSQQTLLNPGQPIQRADRVFRVTATVYDRSNGAFLWRGTAEREDAKAEPHAALRGMLPALLDHFGENASGIAVPPLR